MNNFFLAQAYLKGLLQPARKLIFYSYWVLFSTSVSSAQPPEESWLNIVRQTPYWESQGVADNLITIRRWVLFSESYCSEPQRHLFFDHRGRFLSYIADADSSQATLAQLNTARQNMSEEGRITNWSTGTVNGSGYPFALSCHQPFVDINEAILRLTGAKEEYRLWGTWDGIKVGSPDQQVSLIELMRTVYEHRKEQGRFSFSEKVIPTFLGKVIIESGGLQHALSSEAASGIMQLSPQVLDDCDIPEQFRLHRIVQIDCALRLVEQNHQNLQEPFNAVFGDLPQEKREQLYELLLTQTYLIGVGRSTELLKDEELGKAARYFAKNYQNFSAEDILIGLTYHNMGRRDLGLKTLYYVTDARLAQEALCASAEMINDPWCKL